MANHAIPIEYDSNGNVISPFYGYLPTRYVCYIFVILYIVATLLHTGQAVRYRAWWLLPTVVLAGVGEVIGWGARLWSNYAPLNDTPYLIQIVCTIIAPTPLVGAIFITFGRFIACLGQQYSRLSARLYSRIFLTIDIISLFVQSVGGGLAASANDHAGSQLGSNIMLAGIIFQLVSLTIFSLLMGEYLFRYFQGRPARPLVLSSSSSESIIESTPSNRKPMDAPLKYLLIGLCAETLFLYIRAIYRTIELADGFDGRIIQTEVYFNVLDGAMVVLAMYCLSIFHPARLLQKAAESKYVSDKFPLAFSSSSSAV